MNISQLLITLGLAVVLLGIVLRYAPWLVTWFGHLPGDINVRQAHSQIFIPITSMVLVSLLGSLLANLFFRK
ncbi:DUF2905 domain-containing protein [Methylosoma difficile]